MLVVFSHGQDCDARACVELCVELATKEFSPSIARATCADAAAQAIARLIVSPVATKASEATTIVGVEDIDGR